MTAGPGADAERASSAGRPMIELRQLSKAFGSKVVLRALDLSVAEGESLVIFGPKGAGKTTLIRILAGLSRPSAGTVYIGGLDLRTHAQGIRRYLGVVSHAPLLYESLTAEENLRFFARLYGLEDAEPRLSALLERVGLAGRRGDLVRTFSRGMVQRLAIVRALLHDPLVLLLDEPDTGLDPQAAEMLHALLAEVSGRSGDQPGPMRTIVTVTHHLERGLAMADRVAILVAGRLVFQARARDLTPGEFRPLYERYCGGGGR